MTPFVLFAALALQGSPPPGQSDVTVTGRKAEQPATVREFVTQVTQPTGEQLARFHRRVCPVVLGLADGPALIIEDRIRRTAAAVGARVAASRKCDANLVLVIAEDGGKLVQNMRSFRPAWLAGLSPVEIRRLADEPSPARAWTVASLTNEDGVALGQTGLNEPAALQGVGTMRVMSASIINLPTRAGIDGSVIVLDRAGVVGLSLAQIADYAAMRGLAWTRPPAEARIGTILALFTADPAARPRQMTATDLAYLKSLYRASGRAGAVAERNRIARELNRR
jgi:hypothetical protein